MPSFSFLFEKPSSQQHQQHLLPMAETISPRPSTRDSHSTLLQEQPSELTGLIAIPIPPNDPATDTGLDDEDNFKYSAYMKHAIIGFADGLTVPFALTAGLSSYVTSRSSRSTANDLQLGLLEVGHHCRLG